MYSVSIQLLFLNNQKLKGKQKRERTKHDSDNTLSSCYHVPIQEYTKADIFVFIYIIIKLKHNGMVLYLWFFLSDPLCPCSVLSFSL